MKICNILKSGGITLLLLLFLVSCDSTPDKAEQTRNSSAEDAIAAAKAAYKTAKDERYEWSDTGNILQRAEQALAAGDDATAIKLANQARREAENAVKQKYAEAERAKNTQPQDNTVNTAAAGQYLVISGDNLWDIAGKDEVYGNPYQWPLIYKANHNQIKDADLIYPGQQFAISNSITAADRSSAVQHAKSRGSWSLVVVESIDTAYLAE